MNSNVKYYLDYLDKEMTIMGILSAFCVIVPSVVIERIISIDKNSIAFNAINNLTDKGIWFLILGSVALFISAALFYRQRSRLAWYYGQISLEISLENYTENTAENWMKEADNWLSWLPYNLAFWISMFSVFHYLFAILSAIGLLINQDQIIWLSILSSFFFIIFCVWVIRNSFKYRYEKRLPYFRL